MKKLLKRGATRGSCPATTPAPCIPRNWAPQVAFGAPGGGDGQLSSSYGIALASDARTLLVADANNSRISVWTRPGVTSTLWTNATTFGAYGEDPDQFKGPNSVTVAPNGLTAWVADTGNNRISVWTRPSATSTAWTHQYNLAGPNPGNALGELASPYGAAVSPDTTTLLVADGSNLRVSVWTRPSASSDTWTNPLTFGGPIPGPLKFGNPVAVALARDTLTAWVTDSGNHRISIWTRPDAASTMWQHAGTFGTQGTGPGELYGPFQLALSGTELTMGIADTANNRISVWTRPTTSSHDWTPLTTAGPGGFGADPLGNPYGVAISTGGSTLLANDYVNSRVVMWTVDC